MKLTTFTLLACVAACSAAPSAQSPYSMAGKSGSLEQDFDKATLVGSMRLGDQERLHRSVTLPEGTAMLILAVPDYHCHPIPDVPIDVTVETHGHVAFKESLKLADLTWSFAEGSCDAYGYLEKPESHGSGHGMELTLTSSPAEVMVDIHTKGASISGQRTMLSWFIYGERVPTWKIFGESADSPVAR